MKLPPRYDRLCRNLNVEQIKENMDQGKPYVVRQMMPLEGEVIVNDILRGEIKFNASDLDDQVLVKSNGVPTYHFASVVDDHLMEITHVTRGDEWLPSFPKNVLLYQAFGWEVPKFIHLALILNKSGGKLSKRQGDVFVEDFRAKGYLPEAIINFCALMGWHDKTDKELFTMDELLESFSLDGMGASPAIFDLDKLDYLNGYYLRRKSVSELAVLIRPFLTENLVQAHFSLQTPAYLEAVAATVQERLKKLSDVVDMTRFYFIDKLAFPKEMLAWKTMTSQQAIINLQELKTILEQISIDDWRTAKLEESIMAWLKTNDKKVGEYLWPLRVALTGEKYSPGPFEVMGVMGKENSLKRVDQAIA